MIKKVTILFLSISFFFLQLSSAEEKFLSLKKNKVNVRYGPSFESKIKYIYTKEHLPVKQIDMKDNFRRILDLKNNSGWIHISQLKKSNSLIVLSHKILYKKPSNLSKPVARIEKGRLLIIKKCKKNWCHVNTNDYSGWVNTDNVWGAIK